MKKRHLLLSLAALLLPAVAPAQYTIYPIPQQQTAGTGTVSFTPQVNVVCDEGIDAATRTRIADVLDEHGLTAVFSGVLSATNANICVGVNGQGGTASDKADAIGLDRSVLTKQGKYDRHILSLSDGGGGKALLTVIGENTDAAFMAFASLEQMLDNGTEGLKTVTINDYADKQSRGLVEGYYGYPYSVEVKKDLMRFMMRYKLNTYLYGAKSDPYHSNYWKDPYPTSITEQQKKNGWITQDMIKEITEVSHATKVNFIWAIHPGNAFVGSSTVINDIMGKFEKMYALGVRQFAVFVDDVGVPSSDADMQTNAARVTGLQHAIENKWNKAGAAPTDTVRPLHFVPQIYCTSFASSTDQYNRFFKALASTPSYVTIYTTGGGVWSIPNAGDFGTPQAQLGREVGWWWNYPCNDNADGQIYTSDMYYNFFEMPSVNSNGTLSSTLNRGLGIVSNPMQQGEVSKMPLFSVADYAWNHAGFSNMTSWEASFKAVLPGNAEAQAAYKFLAPYLRWNNPADLLTKINAYKSSKDPEALQTLMREIIKNCDIIIALKDSEIPGESLLYTDLSPWLLKLREMATVTDGLLTVAASDSKEDALWESYLASNKKAAGLTTKEEFKAYALEGMGNGISVSERPSQPSEKNLPAFIDYLRANALKGYLDITAAPTRPQFVTNVEGIKGTATGTSAVYVTTPNAVTLETGQWIGLQLAEPTLVNKITVADTLLTNHSVVRSADGKNWERISAAETVPETYVRYVGVVNDRQEPVSLRLMSQSIRISMPQKPRVAEAAAAGTSYWENHNETYMYDGDYNTFTCINRNQQNGDSYTLKLSKKEKIRRVRIVMGTTNGDYMTEGRVQVSADGSKWTALKISGTNSVAYKMDLPQVQPYSAEAKYCDFSGDGIEAQYVRLYVNGPNTSKWLRLYEIEVNGTDAFQQPRCTDALNNSYPQVADADLSSSTENAQKSGQKGELTYYFQNYALLDGVTLYCDPATMDKAIIATSRDFQEWTSHVFPAEEMSVIRLKFGEDCRDMAALRISWTGDTAPAIYEIVEHASGQGRPVVSEIEEAGESSAAASPAVSLSGNTLRVAAPATGSEARIRTVSVYAADGCLLTLQRLDSAASASLPLLRAGNAPLIVKVTMTDGSSHTYKVK